MKSQVWRARLLQAQLLFLSKANPSRCVPWTGPSSHTSLASDTHMSTNLFMPSLVTVLPPDVLLSPGTACLVPHRSLTTPHPDPAGTNF